MDASVTVAIVSGVGVILSAWIGYMGNKRGTLANAEQNFRDTIIKENEKLRKRVEELEVKLFQMTLQQEKFKVKLIQSGIPIDDLELEEGGTSSE